MHVDLFWPVLAGRGGQTVAIQDRQGRECIFLFHHYGRVLVGNRRENRRRKPLLCPGNVCAELSDGRIERRAVFSEPTI